MKILELESVEKEIDLLEYWLDGLLDSELIKATLNQLELIRARLRAEAVGLPRDTRAGRQDTQPQEPTMMRRLTFDGNFCDIAMCSETPGGSFCEDGACSQRETWERLKAIEDILGTRYDLTHLKNQLERSRPFCLECGKKVEFRVEADFRDILAHGVKFSCWEETAYCAECGRKIDVAEIEDANTERRQNAYGRARRERERQKQNGRV